MLVPYGRMPGGQLVYANETARGIKCGAVCPLCHAPLVSKQGEVIAWHFAHAAEGGGQDSGGGGVPCGETLLHRAAKAAIVSLAPSKRGEVGGLLRVGGMAAFGRVKSARAEYWIKALGRRVDTALTLDVIWSYAESPARRRIAGLSCVLEVCVTNPKDDDYKAELAAAGIPAYELRLSMDDVMGRIERMRRRPKSFESALRTIVQQHRLETLTVPGASMRLSWAEIGGRLTAGWSGWSDDLSYAFAALKPYPDGREIRKDCTGRCGCGAFTRGGYRRCYACHERAQRG